MKSQSTMHKPTTSTGWHFQWVKAGEEPSLAIKPGEIAGFERQFKDSAGQLSEFFLAVTGTQRFEVANWLNHQAGKLGLNQYVTEIQVTLKHPYQHRINGVNENQEPIDEYELLKATQSLKDQVALAWSEVVLSCENFDHQTKIDLMKAAASNDINAFLPISAYLFSKTIERMPEKFQSAQAIIFPAIPLACDDWYGKPVKMIAFRKETIVSMKPMWKIERPLAA